MPSFSRDQIIIQVFPRSTLNSMIDYVAKAAKYNGTRRGSQGPVNSGAWSADHETREFIYADKINELLEGISSLSGQSAGNSVSKDDVIYADFFSGISSTINELKLSPSACGACVTSCDTTCDTCNACDECETCNTCNGCDSCQSVTSYSSHYSSHYSSTPVTPPTTTT